jgi:hypothetical protein
MKLLRWPSLVAEEKDTNSELFLTNGTVIKNKRNVCSNDSLG